MTNRAAPESLPTFRIRSYGYGTRVHILRPELVSARWGRFVQTVHVFVAAGTRRSLCRCDTFHHISNPWDRLPCTVVVFATFPAVVCGTASCCSALHLGMNQFPLSLIVLPVLVFAHAILATFTQCAKIHGHCMTAAGALRNSRTSS